MLNYSTYLWKNPNMEDSTYQAYGRLQYSNVMSFDEFVAHISEHNGVFSTGTVQGVVTDAVSCLLEMLLNGNKVQFGRLGTFGLSLGCTPAPSLKEFTANNIKTVNVLFSPGKDFANMRDKASFNLVNTRAVQEATLRATKEGVKNVELPIIVPSDESSDSGPDII